MESDPNKAGSQTRASSSSPSRVVSESLPEFAAFAKILVSSMREVSEIAEKGVSNFLLALGTAILLLVLFMKLRLVGLQVADLAASEFILVVIVSALFIFFGAYLRLYQYRKEHDIWRSLTDTGSRLIEKTVEASARIQEKGLEAARELTGQERSGPAPRI